MTLVPQQQFLAHFLISVYFFIIQSFPTKKFALSDFNFLALHLSLPFLSWWSSCAIISMSSSGMFIYVLHWLWSLLVCHCWKWWLVTVHPTPICTSGYHVGVCCPLLVVAHKLYRQDCEADVGGPSAVDWLRMSKKGFNPNQLDERGISLWLTEEELKKTSWSVLLQDDADALEGRCWITKHLVDENQILSS